MNRSKGAMRHHLQSVVRQEANIQNPSQKLTVFNYYFLASLHSDEESVYHQASSTTDSTN